MFRNLATDPQNIYYDLIHQYKKFFFDSNYGLVLVYKNQIVNVNPKMLKLLDCPAPNSLLGSSIFTFLETPLERQMTAQSCTWETPLGVEKCLETLFLQFNMNEGAFSAYLIGESHNEMHYLEAIAKQLALIFQEQYRPLLIFDAANPETQQLLGANHVARHFFDLEDGQNFSLSQVIHEKDYLGYQAYADTIQTYGTSQYAFQLQRDQHYSHGVVVQNYTIDQGEKTRILSLFRDNLYHHAFDEKTQFNYKRLQDYFSVTPHAMAIVDKDLVIREVNLGFTHQFKFSDEEIIGKSLCSLISGPCKDHCLHAEGNEKVYNFADRYGNNTSMRVHDVPLFLEEEYIGNYYLFSEAYLPVPLDIKQLKEDLFNLTPEHIVLLDEKFELVWSNINYSDYAKSFSSPELAKNIKSYLAKASVETFTQMAMAMANGAPFQAGQLWLYSPDGRKRLCNTTLTRLDTTDGERLYAAVVNHYQKNSESNDLIKVLAYQEPTLNLPNHVYTTNLLEGLIQSGEATQHRFSTLAIRLFQKDSDYPSELRHEVYQTAALNIAAIFEKDIEISLSDSNDLLIVHKGIRTKRNALRTLLLIQKELSLSLESHGIDVLSSCRFGFAQYPQDGKTVDALLKALTLALESKNGTSKGLQQYEAQLQAPIKREGMVLKYLREGLHKGEFYIVYQPLIDLKTKKVVGIETLLRWKNETIGNPMPDEFIPLAEKSDAIVKLGYFVIGETVRKLYKLRSKGYNLTSSINISIKQLEVADFSEQIIRVLTDYDLPPSAIQFEITESISASSHANVMANIMILSQYGIVFNIDDFGTGYSSLKQLQSLKVKGLKIDKSLIQDIAENPESEMLVKALSAMAKNIGLKLIAEGVESKEQLDILESIGFEEAQGFLFSVPLVDQDLDCFMDENDSQLFS